MIVRMVLGYLFWFFLGWLGVHRFFLGRSKSGLLLLLLSVTSMLLFALVLGPLFSVIADAEDPSVVDEAALELLAAESPYLLPAMITGGVVGLWLLADLILVALMVLKDAEKADLARQEAGSTVVYGANMDPSFQATQQAAGLDDFDDKPQRKALPDDYVMPWRQDNPRGEQKMYRPGED